MQMVADKIVPLTVLKYLMQLCCGGLTTKMKMGVGCVLL